MANQNEVDKVKQEPLKYLVNKTFPKDVNTKPNVFIIGKSHSGKTGLAKLIEKKLGLVRIKPSQILEEFLEEHIYPASDEATQFLKSGTSVPDQLMAALIQKRTLLADCVENGYVIDGYPKTREQAECLAGLGIVPQAVFSLQLSQDKVKYRSQAAEQAKFGYKTNILHQKLLLEGRNMPNLENFYTENYNNISFLDSTISKWGLLDQAKRQIYDAVLQRQCFARSLITDEPVCIGNMCITPSKIIQNLSNFDNISPVTIKTQRNFVQNELLSPYLVYFDKFIYILNSMSEVDDFLRRPDLYIYQKINKMELAQQVSLENIPEASKNVTHKGYCVTSLLNNHLVKGQLDILVAYRGNMYTFCDSKQKNLFDKLPVSEDNKNLVKKVAKKGECTAYLEHHLGGIVMKCLAQLGYKRLKYPTINCKETALKFIAISLKASNVNQTPEYRKKYEKKLQQFLKHCNYAVEIREEFQRKQNQPEKWQSWDEENLLKVTAEFEDFMKDINNSEKDPFFAKFIR